MEDWFDGSGVLRLDEIVTAQPSFQKIMQDGRVTSAEYGEQVTRVTELLQKLNRSLAPEQKAIVTSTLSELAVLMALSHVGSRAAETV